MPDQTTNQHAIAGADAGASQLAVVTGASNGIGLELARVFARNGFDLFIIGGEDGIDAAASHLRSTGARVDATRADLATSQGVRDVYERMASLGRPIDVMAINAGVNVGGRFVERSLEEDLDLINLGVVSSVVLAKLVLRDMVQRNHGRVLFTSIAVNTPAPLGAVYGASKAFIEALTQALHTELRGTNVTVTALQPGAPGATTDDPAAIARDAFDALMAGKDQIVTAAPVNVTPATPAEQHPKPSESGPGAEAR